jgi:ABC-type antimicrobial peptide transport system ATPase subunit
MVKIIVMEVETGKEIMNIEAATAIVSATNPDKDKKCVSKMQAFIYGKPRSIIDTLEQVSKQVEKQVVKTVMKDVFENMFGDDE